MPANGRRDLIQRLKVKVVAANIRSTCSPRHVQTWSRQGIQGLRPCDSRVLRKTSEPNGDNATQDCRQIHKRELQDSYTSLHVIWITKLRWMRFGGGGGEMRRKWRRERHTEYWWDRLEFLGVDGKIILKWISENGVLQTAFVCLRTRISGGLLWTRQWTLLLRKRLGIPWLAEELFPPQEIQGNSEVPPGFPTSAVQ